MTADGDTPLTEWIATARQWRERLETTLATRSITLFHQPIRALDDGALLAHETLARIRDGDSFLTAGAFFPFAERFDLASELDILIASALLADLPEDVPAFLNLSSRSIVDPAFGVWLTDALQASSIPRDRLIIEFPELALQVDRDRTADLMRMAVAAGYRISIDHVGTSSTTFEYLGQLPLSFAKVDRKYVHGLTDSAENRLLLTTLVQLARTRNIVLIAEGVETRQERAGLLDAGVHFGLGFLLGEPGSDRMS